MNNNLIRIIPFLDIKNGLLIKGINLEGLRIIGKAKNFSNFYYNNGADEICYIDNVATLYGTNNLSKFITNTAKDVFIPLSVGGGVRSIQDIKSILLAGADKICVNSAAIENINFLKVASRIFGSANITVIIQAIKIDNKYFISSANGREIHKINPFDWAKKVQDYGAGEIVVTSVNNEGLKGGFDLKLTKKISEIVSIPTIAHGGAGSFEDIYNVIKSSKISGVGIASLFHYETLHFFPKFKPNTGNVEFLKNVSKKKIKVNLIYKLKKFLKSKNINVRYEN